MNSQIRFNSYIGNFRVNIKKNIESKFFFPALLFCLILHRCDQLKPDIRIQHPVVRIHIVNMDTGQYVKKKDRYV